MAYEIDEQACPAQHTHVYRVQDRDWDPPQSLRWRFSPRSPGPHAAAAREDLEVLDDTDKLPWDVAVPAAKLQGTGDGGPRFILGQGQVLMIGGY
ncbi:hypothetical protein N7462_011379 [Penicillium macrosclerotiorum]|uniref:uncharacterized protein n=1 Tax=Penicillium macrosclerotiorum TaxID=303699 RepID=UPI0025486ED5|nr:uncharacterized protein N7462_011379 [Penicillium macrosclerotiorum]KAJ5666970.1 hypothetical protein N7462_011379 [Penicillium macrosclerotiorum]